MNFIKWIKKTPHLGLTISVGLHLLFIAVYGFWLHSKDHATIKYSPLREPISLGSFNGQSKILKKTPLTGPHSTASTNSKKNLNQSELTVQTYNSQTNDGSSNTGFTDGQPVSAKQKYFLEFRKIIESKKQYPLIARKRNMEGVVSVSVTIKNNGEVTNHKITSSSGHSALDEAAISMIRSIVMFKSFPSELDESEVEFKLPVTYKLNN